jgi:hypothetical protein
MKRRPPPLPVLSALAHGATACGIVALVAGLWIALPGPHDALTALMTAGAVGGLAWLVARGTARPRFAANDNDPAPAARCDWRPVDRMA